MLSRNVCLLMILLLSAMASTAIADDSGFALPLGDNWRVTPYVAPGYTPEMGGLLAAGGLFSFSAAPTDTMLKRSSFLGAQIEFR